MLYSLAVLSTLTVIEDSVTLRSNDLALLKLAKVELDTSGTERSFAESSDISYKYKMYKKLQEVHFNSRVCTVALRE